MLGATLLISTHSSAYALIDLNVGGSAGTESGASSSASGSIDANVGGGSQQNTGTSSSPSADGESEVEVNLERDMLGSDTEGEVMTSSEAVLTNADLRAYAQTALRGDEGLEAMSFTGETVEVRYKQQGRFLALVPITFNVKAVVDAEGKVDLNYPWYAFLTLDDQEKIKTELKIAVDNALRARAVGSVRAEGQAENPRFTAAESAEVAAQVHAILRSNFEASESVD